MANCPICGEDPGFYINGEPLCVHCTSRQPCAVVQGGNASDHKDDGADLFIAVRSCVALDIVLTFVAWLVWEIHRPLLALLR